MGKSTNEAEIRKQINTFYFKHSTLLTSQAAFLGVPASNRESVIHDFTIDKIYTDSVKELRIINSKHPSQIRCWFKHYVFDIKRKNKTQLKGLESYKAAMANLYIIEEDRSINDIDANIHFQEVIRQYRELIAERFRNKLYINIFNMMLKGISNETMAESLNQKIAFISTAKRRIRNFLKKNISILQNS